MFSCLRLRIEAIRRIAQNASAPARLDFAGEVVQLLPGREVSYVTSANLLSAGPGSHVCLLHRGFEEQREAVLPFIAQGLRNGEQCYYVADEQPPDVWRFEFHTSGIDVEAETRAGKLIVCSGEYWRRATPYNSIQNGREAWRMIENGLAAFRGVRFVIDLGWTLEPPIPDDIVCHWEATLNTIVDGGLNVRFLCQYNLLRHSAAGIHSALRTHPTAMLHGLCRPNPYYEAPRILANEPHLNHSSGDAQLLEGMLISLSEGPVN